MADRIEVMCTISILVATHHIASVDAESKCHYMGRCLFESIPLDLEYLELVSVSKLDMPGPYLGGVHLKVCTAAPRTLGILSMAIVLGALSWCALAGEIMADRMVVNTSFQSLWQHITLHQWVQRVNAIR